MTEGEQLRKLIKKSSKTAEEWGKKAGISRGQIFALYKEVEISDYYKDKLKAAGIEIKKSIETPEVRVVILAAENKALRTEIDHLKKIIALLETKNKKK